MPHTEGAALEIEAWSTAAASALQGPRGQGAKMEEPDANLDAIARQIVDTAFRLHRDVGPGLLESAYETLLSAKLTAIGLHVARQVTIDAVVDDIHLPSAFRIDL